MFLLYEPCPMGTLQTIPVSCLHVSSLSFFKYSYFLDHGSGSSDVWSQANINLSVPQFPSEIEISAVCFYETIKPKFVMLPSSSVSPPQSMSGTETSGKRWMLGLSHFLFCFSFIRSKASVFGVIPLTFKVGLLLSIKHPQKHSHKYTP